MQKLKILSLLHHFPFTVEPTLIWVFSSSLCKNYFLWCSSNVLMRQISNEYISQFLDLTVAYFILEIHLSFWLHDITLYCLSSSFLGHSLQAPPSLLYWYILEYPWTLFLDYIFVFSMSLFPWLSHSLFGVKYDPSNASYHQTYVCVPVSYWGLAMCVHLHLDIL